MLQVSNHIKKCFLLLGLLNVIYFTVYLLKSRTGSWDGLMNTEPEYLNVDLEQQTDPQHDGHDYKQEIQKLLDEVAENKDNKHWLQNTQLIHTSIDINPQDFFNDSTRESAWRNKNTLFFDPRVTLALYLNHIRHQFELPDANQNQVLVPFSWSDWIDLTGLNADLEKPLDQRNNCKWVRQFSIIESSVPDEVLQCCDNKDITPRMLEQFGFQRHEQLPGFITYGHSVKRAFQKVRLAQAKSYALTHMPNPYLILFLNKDGGTYEVLVDGNEETNGRIVNTGMMNEFVHRNLPKDSNSVPDKWTFDPVTEFKALKKAVKPQFLAPEDDVLGMYKTTHKKGTSKALPLPAEAFDYTAANLSRQRILLQRLAGQKDLTKREEIYLESIQESMNHHTFNEWPYFRQATLEFRKDPGNKDSDRGWHYDWRFFNGGLTYQEEGWTPQERTTRTTIILHRLLRNWFRFAEEKGIVTWIMHGPLLSWYWNGFMFPFDNDIDIQMPVLELVRLGEKHNQTLVIEDIEEGFGKYLIDVGTFIHNRDISRRENHIDARFIDVDTGIYIDITGLSSSKAEVPEEYYQLGMFDKGLNEPIYNDRRKHFYTLDQLSPLRFTQMSGVPLYVPNQISERLTFEYINGMVSTEFKDWHFVPKLNLWVAADDVKAAFDANDYKVGDSVVALRAKLTNLVLEMSDEEVYMLLTHNEAILSEYYVTRNLTSMHAEEKKFLFEEADPNEPRKFKRPLSVIDKSMKEEETKKYIEFVNKNMKMTLPLRKPLFQYEHEEQPQHHHEYIDNN